MAKRWTNKEILYLKENAADTHMGVMVKHLGRTRESIYYKLRQLDIARGNVSDKFTKREREILRDKYPNMLFDELMQRHFPNRSETEVRGLARTLKLRVSPRIYAIGRARIVAGTKEAIRRVDAPLKALQLDIRGGKPTWLIKIAQYNVYEPLHYYLYKKYVGEIPEGHQVTFLDGNRFNMSIDNLFCASLAAIASTSRVPKGNPKLRKSLILIKELCIL